MFSALIRHWMTLALASAILLLGPPPVKAQTIGLGSSLFFPVDASMAVSVPPIALRGTLLGNEYWELEFGLTWYRMAGLSGEGLPFPMDQSLVEPFNSFMIPLQIGGRIPLGNTWRLEPKVGGFMALNSIYSVHQEHLSKAITRSTGEWRAMQTAAEIGQSNTFGLLTSVFLAFSMGDEWEIKCGVSWIEGRSAAPITGSAIGISQNDVPMDLALDFPNATLDYRGVELALAVQFKLTN